MKVVVCFMVSLVWNWDTGEVTQYSHIKDFKSYEECELWKHQQSFLGPHPGAVATWRFCGYEYRV